MGPASTRRAALGGVAAASIALAAGCESLAGLTGGGGDSGASDHHVTAHADAGHDAHRSADASTDARKLDDATVHADAGGGTDAGHDAVVPLGDAGSVPWHFVCASAEPTPPSPTVTSCTALEVGDLVIWGSDIANPGTAWTLSALPGDVFDSFQQVGPVWGNGCEEIAAWGIVKNVPSGGLLTITENPPLNTGYQDVVMNVFRGGSPVPHLLPGTPDNPTAATGGAFDASTRLGCGTIDTAPNGVAFAISFINNGGTNFDPGALPFVQSEAPAGNPSAYATPTDGGRVTAVMLGGHAGEWSCMTFALGP
jgi:hypothetical protein